MVENKKEPSGTEKNAAAGGKQPSLWLMRATYALMVLAGLILLGGFVLGVDKILLWIKTLLFG